MSARVAVVQFPGVNCEAESARAVRAAGLGAELVPWTAGAAALAAFDAYVLPGGFSYQDRVRAGAVAARHELLETVRARAGAGAPVLGICNGAQVLVEAGLVPGGGGAAATPGAALAPNRMPDRTGYLARWVWCEIQSGCSLFTQAYAPGEIVPLPVAHAEGRFTTAADADWARLEAAAQVPVRYAPGPAPGAAAPPGDHYPWNPNGSRGDAAALGNARGNVLALMPHPERAQDLLQVPLDLPGGWGERRRRVAGGALAAWSLGPGAGFFLSLAAALGVAGPGGAR
jgi:phosphoribosylformylglycinamidine synthase subunit PurQ / glutaminase